MNDIYGISWISPRWGFKFYRSARFHRALPYAIDLTPLGLRNNEQLSNSCETSQELNRICAESPHKLSWPHIEK